MSAVQSIIFQYLNPILAGIDEDPETAKVYFRDFDKDPGLDTMREKFNKQWIDYCEEC